MSEEEEENIPDNEGNLSEEEEDEITDNEKQVNDFSIVDENYLNVNPSFPVPVPIKYYTLINNDEQNEYLDGKCLNMCPEEEMEYRKNNYFQDPYNINIYKWYCNSSRFW